MKLADLKKGQSATIQKVLPDHEISNRLCEMGLIEGSRITVVHQALGGDPFTVQVRGTLIALNRLEAQQVEVIE